MFKKVTVVMLPTNEKASVIGLYIDTNNLVFNNPNNKDIPRGISQHLYILSDDEIKEGNWKLCLNDNSTSQYLSKKSIESDTKCKDCKKIIATTDKSLTKEMYSVSSGKYQEPLPQPSQSFIEVFVEEYNKGNIITEVMVEYENNTPKFIPIDKFNSKDLQDYIKLKINPKNNTISIRKIKDSWNREEVVNLLNLAWATASAYGENTNSADCNDWIDKNL